MPNESKRTLDKFIHAIYSSPDAALPVLYEAAVHNLPMCARADLIDYSEGFVNGLCLAIITLLHREGISFDVEELCDALWDEYRRGECLL